MKEGRCARLDALKGDEKINAAMQLMGVWGIGAVHAYSLAKDEGLLSVEALRARVRSARPARALHAPP